MPYITASGVSIPQGPDAFTPPSQFKDWADAEAAYDNFFNVNLDSDRTSLAAPVLRDGIFCWVRTTKLLWQYIGATWSLQSQSTNLQLDTTNSVVQTITQIGIGKIVGNGTAGVSETVTFPVAFSGTPVVMLTPQGYRATGAFNPAGLTFVEARPTASSVGTTSFIAALTFATAGTAANDFYYAWTATGTI